MTPSWTRGVASFAPGGIVYVDATLIYSLTVVAGLPAAQAVAVAGLYRLISFVLVAIVGWIVFASGGPIPEIHLSYTNAYEIMRGAYTDGGLSQMTTLATPRSLLIIQV